MDEYSGNWDIPLFDEDEEENAGSFLQMYELCVEPTLAEVFQHIWKLLLINFIFRLITQIKPPSDIYCHLISAVCGVTVIALILRSSPTFIIIFILYCYFMLLICRRFITKHWAYWLSFFCTAYLIISEFFYPLSEVWTETRGLHMIVAMKIISACFDFEKGSLIKLPDLFEYLGYTLCPSNCLFGPWISFDAYLSVFNYQTPIVDFRWAKQIIRTTFIAVVFLTFSNCWAYWLIPQSWSWLIAYQEAFSFRSSHYFISYLSEAAMIAGGYGYGSKKKKQDPTWGYPVTSPLAIEVPRSLVQVVVYWNIPMHVWLKNYVFLVCKPMGSFFAIIMTYLISSFLHGFNLRLAAVLLSLGLYTYVEYKFRHKLSGMFEACILANPCKRCSHLNKDNKYVWITNVIFGAIAMYHLAYLGCLLDTTSYVYQSEIEMFLKWHNLGYASHVLTLHMYVINRLL